MTELESIGIDIEEENPFLSEEAEYVEEFEYKELISNEQYIKNKRYVN